MAMIPTKWCKLRRLLWFPKNGPRDPSSSRIMDILGTGLQSLSNAEPAHFSSCEVVLHLVWMRCLDIRPLELQLPCVLFWICEISIYLYLMWLGSPDDQSPCLPPLKELDCQSPKKREWRSTLWKPHRYLRKKSFGKGHPLRLRLNLTLPFGFQVT